MDQMLQKLMTTFSNRSVAIENEAEYLSSAVIVPLIRQGKAWHVLFEVRASNLNRQPGEICFPGGRIEPDESPLEAAMRETSEELGIGVESIKPLGSLNYVVATMGVILHPFVAYISEEAALSINHNEVAEVFTIPLDWLIDTEPQEAYMEVATRPMEGFPFHLLPPTYPDDWKRRKSYTVLFYEYKQYVVWGLTARVLNSFVKLCRETQVKE